MKIYLKENNEWILFNNPTPNDFSVRGIKIGKGALIGEGAKIDDNAEIEEQDNPRDQRIRRMIDVMTACKADAKAKGYKRGKAGQGEIECPFCKGRVRYSVACGMRSKLKM